MPKAKILLVDDNVAWTLQLTELLIRDDCEVFSANRISDAWLLLEVHSIDVVVADINMLQMDAMAFLEQLRQMYPNSSVIVFTARGSIAQAVQATKLGVSDYFEKPAQIGEPDGLRDKVTRAVQQRHTAVGADRADRSQYGLLAAPVQGFYGILSKHPLMLDIFELIQTIADSAASVMIHGETGTGKELVARAIHEASNRHGKPFVALDCSALARELLESELFGHEKGAFTGAIDRHSGRFERANGGTLFLDEVANINWAVQSKLLRVLQTRSFERVGGQKQISVDVRIIAASNQPLADCIAEGSFREDLYHRLNVVEIGLPPLRDRKGDVPLLAMEFLRRFAREHRKELRGFTDDAIEMLNGYHWPGNVRELENVVLQSVVLAKSPIIDAPELPQRILSAKGTGAAGSARLADQLGEPEKLIIVNALRQHGGNIKRTAATLQVSRTTLYAKLKKYQIDPDLVR